MTDDSYESYRSQCYEFGLRLVKPRGLRKYYCLDKDRYRFRLGRTWDEAKVSIWAGIRWLFENYEPLRLPNVDHEQSQQSAEVN